MMEPTTETTTEEGSFAGELGSETGSEATTSRTFTPTITQSDVEAQAFMDGLDTLMATIQWLRPYYAPAAKKARGRRAVTRQFMMTTAASVEQNEDLQVV